VRPRQSPPSRALLNNATEAAMFTARLDFLPATSPQRWLNTSYQTLRLVWNATYRRALGNRRGAGGGDVACPCGHHPCCGDRI
jgi:hypothetical protein